MRETLFGISYCLVYFNPFGLVNEIWPYYILFAFATSYSLQYFLLIFGYLFLALTAAIFIEGFQYLDILQVMIVMQTALYISNLSDIQMEKICNVFIIFFLISIVVGVGQFLVPPIQELTYSFFSGNRPFLETLAIDRKSVTLLGPEPAYSASHILSMYLFILYCRRNSFYVALSFIILILMTRPVSVLLAFPLVVIIGVLNNRISSYFVYFASIFSLPIIIAFQENIKLAFIRVIAFLDYSLNDWNIVEAEERMGSSRISQILDTVFVLFPENYVKPFSFIGALNITTCSLAIVIFIPIFLFLLRKNFLTALLGLALAIISGPVLISLTFVSIFLLSYKKRVTS